MIYIKWKNCRRKQAVLCEVFSTEGAKYYTMSILLLFFCKKWETNNVAFSFQLCWTQVEIVWLCWELQSTVLCRTGHSRWTLTVLCWEYCVCTHTSVCHVFLMWKQAIKTTSLSKHSCSDALLWKEIPMLFPNICQKVETHYFEREIGSCFFLWVWFWFLFSLLALVF